VADDDAASGDQNEAQRSSQNALADRQGQASGLERKEESTTDVDFSYKDVS